MSENRRIVVNGLLNLIARRGLGRLLMIGRLNLRLLNILNFENKER